MIQPNSLSTFRIPFLYIVRRSMLNDFKILWPRLFSGKFHRVSLLCQRQINTRWVIYDVYSILLSSKQIIIVMTSSWVKHKKPNQIKTSFYSNNLLVFKFKLFEEVSRRRRKFLATAELASMNHCDGESLINFYVLFKRRKKLFFRFIITFYVSYELKLIV